MNFSDITPAGAYVNAIKVANERDRQEATRCLPIVPTGARPGLRRTMRQVLARVMKTVVGRRVPAGLRFRKA